MSGRRPPIRPEDRYRYIGLFIAVVVLIAAFAATPDWWNDFH